MTTQIEPNTAHIYTLQSDRLRALARTLDREGSSADALAILELLAAGEPPHADTLTLLVQLYGKLGESLKAIQTLNLLKTVTADPSLLLEEVNRFMPAAIQSFNENLAGGHVEEAEKYAASLAALNSGKCRPAQFCAFLQYRARAQTRSRQLCRRADQARRDA